MADERRRIANGNHGPATPPVDDDTNKIVQLEGKHDELQRNVDEQRKTVATLADSVYRAKIDAAQKLAEQDRLTVLDSAFKPSVPSGPPKSIFLMAGVVLFFGLGGALAVGLALIDDRLYRRHDIDELRHRRARRDPAVPSVAAQAEEQAPGGMSGPNKPKSPFGTTLGPGGHNLPLVTQPMIAIEPPADHAQAPGVSAVFGKPSSGAAVPNAPLVPARPVLPAVTFSPTTVIPSGLNPLSARPPPRSSLRLAPATASSRPPTTRRPRSGSRSTTCPRTRSRTGGCRSSSTPTRRPPRRSACCATTCSSSAGRRSSS